MVASAIVEERNEGDVATPTARAEKLSEPVQETKGGFLRHMDVALPPSAIVGTDNVYEVDDDVDSPTLKDMDVRSEADSSLVGRALKGFGGLVDRLHGHGPALQTPSSGTIALALTVGLAFGVGVFVGAKTVRALR